MEKKNSFKEELNCSEVKEEQEKLVSEKIRSEIFREISNLHLENHEKGPRLEEIITNVGNRYGISDISNFLKTMKESLDSNEYLYQLDEEGHIVAQYTETYMRQMREQEEQNEIANAKLRRYASKVREVLNRLPEIVRQEELVGEEVEEGFLKIAIEKAMRTYLEKDFRLEEDFLQETILEEIEK